MFRYLYIFSILFYLPIFASIRPISSELLQNMTANGSHKSTCPISSKQLRVVSVPYIDFKGQSKTGKLIVHKHIAKKVEKIFDKLYQKRYRIERIRPIWRYGANDHDSISANNTSAYNCRKIAGTTKWSNHAYGLAIDINPIQNPYISRSGQTTHKESRPFVDRSSKQKHSTAMIQPDSYIVKLFKRHGFKWGGDWRSIKDYQHFEYKRQK